MRLSIAAASLVTLLPLAPGIAAGQAPIVAIDVPSGLDADSGAGQEGAVRASATITLVAPKTALRGNPNAGRVFVADIGMPIGVLSTNREALTGLYQIADVVELTN